MPGLAVGDVRWYPDGSGRSRYEAGHLPGAVFLDADEDLAARPFVDGPGRHPLPEPERFADTMSRRGIGDGDLVIAYDDDGGSIASRLWWMLVATGRRCAVLDGGLEAWPGSLETGEVSRPAAAFSPRPWPPVATADDVIEVLRAGGVVLDARAPERYRGEVEPIDPVPGHIPGARSAPWAHNLDPSTGRFLPAEVLRRHYGELCIRDAGDAVASCGSGITATHDLLAMVVAGLGLGRLYEGSWSGWVNDPSHPVATGAEPGVLQ